LLEHFPDFVYVVAHPAEDPEDGQVKYYRQKLNEKVHEGVIRKEIL